MRNTPTKHHSSTPTQRLFSHRTRTSLPVANSLLQPELVATGSVQFEMEHQVKLSKHYYDKNAGSELQELSVGDYVYIKPPPSIEASHGSMARLSTSLHLDHMQYQHGMVLHGGTNEIGSTTYQSSISNTG